MSEEIKVFNCHITNISREDYRECAGTPVVCEAVTTARWMAGIPIPDDRNRALAHRGYFSTREDAVFYAQALLENTR